MSRTNLFFLSSRYRDSTVYNVFGYASSIKCLCYEFVSNIKYLSLKQKAPNNHDVKSPKQAVDYKVLLT